MPIQVYDECYTTRGPAAKSSPHRINKGWTPLIDFTARDNPKVKEVKAEEILDDSIVKELDESGFAKSLGLK